MTFYEKKNNKFPPCLIRPILDRYSFLSMLLSYKAGEEGKGMNVGMWFILILTYY